MGLIHLVRRARNLAAGRTGAWLIGCALAVSASCALAQTPPTVTLALGNLENDVQSDYQTPSYSIEVTLTDNEVKWYSFTLTSPISEADGRYLDIDTYPNTDRHVDTTIGLYDSTGARIGVNADAGVVFYSQMSFGLVSPPRGPISYDTFDSEQAFGADGELAVGTYYLAVTRFHATMGDTDFAVSSESNGTDTFLLQFRGQTSAVVPEPATLGLAALGTSLLLYGYRRRTARA